MSKAQIIVDRLRLVKQSGEGKWMACCPAHSDKSPSLRITELRDGRVLMHCFGGCSTVDIMAAIGLEMSDLFPDDDHYEPLPGLRKKRATPSEDEFILLICKEARKRGDRLTEAEKQREREAFMRLRRKAG